MKRAIIFLLTLLLVPASQASVKLYIFDCGHIYRDDISDLAYLMRRPMSANYL